VTGYLTRGVATAGEVREAVYRTQDVEEARARLNAFFDRLEAENADDVFDDVAYEVTDPRLKPGDKRNLHRRA